MPHNRIWTDPKAEAEFWQRMVQLEHLSDRGPIAAAWSRMTRWIGRHDPAEMIRRQADDLVQRHTILAPNAARPDIVDEVPSAALRTLANLTVSLRQDRTADEDEATRSA